MEMIIMKLEDKIKLSKANHKLWIKNLERYGELDLKRFDGTITEEERKEMRELKMPPVNWDQSSKTIGKPKAKPKAKPKKKQLPKRIPPAAPVFPEPEPVIVTPIKIEVFTPPDPTEKVVEEIVEEIIELTKEEKKAIRRQQLEAQIAELEES